METEVVYNQPPSRESLHGVPSSCARGYDVEAGYRWGCSLGGTFDGLKVFNSVLRWDEQE